MNSPKDSFAPDFAPGAPMEAAARVYFSRGAKEEVSNNRLWLIVGLQACAMIAFGIVISALLPLKTVETIQVRKEDGGRLVADGAAVGNWTPDRESIAYFINQWASTVFDIEPASLDRTVMESAALTIGSASAQLQEQRTRDNPYVLLQKHPGLVRNYEFRTINWYEDNSNVALLRFKTHTRINGDVKTESWAMRITFTRVKPTTVAQVMKNPAGLFITSFNLTTEMNAQSMIRSAILSLLCILALAPAAAAPPKKAAVAAPVEDEARAIPVGRERRIVRYTYSPDVIFRVLTQPNLHTHIELGEDEGLKEKPVTGDSVQWRLSGGPRNLYVKPVREGIETSLTVVTNKRVYQFQLIAGNRDAAVFQKISFDYPDRDAEVKLAQEIITTQLRTEESRLAEQIITPNVHPGALDFGFEISGNAPFRPTAVYSDNKFTYLRMPDAQDSPAVFLVDDDGTPSLINYVVKGNMIVVERVARYLLLKIGGSEVLVSKQGAPRMKMGR